MRLPKSAWGALELRPYQHDVLTAIDTAALRGVKRQVMRLPTSAGKAVMVSHLIVERQERALVLGLGAASRGTSPAGERGAAARPSERLERQDAHAAKHPMCAIAYNGSNGFSDKEL
jgi:hypothetical protein